MLPIPWAPVEKTYPLPRQDMRVDQSTLPCRRVVICTTRCKKLTAAERHSSPPPFMDDPERSVRLLFTSAWCRATSSAVPAAIFDRDHPANIEVLEEFKLHDGDAFRSGDVPVTYPPMPQIDRETHR